VAKILRRAACHGIRVCVGRGYPPESMNYPNRPLGLLSTSQSREIEPMLLRPQEAAKLLAISPRKLWQLTNMGEVPVVRIGRSLRYPREELRAWISKRQRARA